MNNKKTKIVFAFAGFIVIFVVLLGRAFQIQIVNSKKLISYSRDQTYRINKVYPHRGNIYDRNGSPLAINIKTYSIFTIPKNMKGGLKQYRELSRIVPELKYKTILKKVKNRKIYTWLARKISLSKKQVDKIKNISGIYIDAVPKRLYPNHELLSQTLGFVGVDNVGLAGLEYLYDKELKGRPKITKYLKDAKGRAIKFESQQVGGDVKNLNLSIDKELQAVAEKSLKEAVKKYNAFRGGIGVMDTKTGEILAIANYPTYDAEKLNKANLRYRKLAYVTDPFEPGSSFKILTIASALEHKIIRPDTNYYCERGKYKVGNHFIGEADSKNTFEWLSVNEIIKYSSNIGTTKIAFDLTFPKLDKTLRKFNIGKKTNIGIPGESRGIYDFDYNISPLSLSNVGFGQGLATTGIQLLAAYSAIANNGVYITPTLFVRNDKIIEGKRIISKKTARELTEMLISVVEDGTGPKAKIDDFVIAGKTSTAERADSRGGYSGYVAGFVGFPVNVNKKFVINVYIDNPKGREYYGNSVAAPVFKEVAQYLLYKNKEYNKLTNKNENIKKTDYLDTVTVQKSSITNIGNGKVPNLIGLDKMSIIKYSKKYKFKIKHLGMGIVKKQFPRPGTILKKDTIITLKYLPPYYE